MIIYLSTQINSNTKVYGGNLITTVNHAAHRFLLFKALNDNFGAQFFSGLHFYTIPETLVACRTMHLRFFFNWQHC